MLIDEERRAIREAFSEAAEHYDAEARIQREIAEHLAASHRLDRGPQCILDAGCGTGYGGKLLSSAYPGARVVSVDAAHLMCKKVRQNVVCADIEHLPLANGSVDLYWSSLVWQWTNAEHSAREASRVLKPGATLLVATLGPDTLSELRYAFRPVDDKPHVRDFPSVDGYAKAFASCDLTLRSLQRRRHVFHCENVTDVLRSIRGIGAHTLGAQRRRGLMGRSSWLRFCAAYESLRTEGGLPTTYDAVYLTATKD